MISVYLVDDHPLLIAGLTSILEQDDSLCKVVGSAKSGAECLKRDKSLSVDVFIVDISMEPMNGFETCVALLKENSKAHIIFLSMHDDSMSVIKSIQCGGQGYVLKDNAVDEIVTAIENVIAGKPYLSPSISQLVIDQVRDLSRQKNGSGLSSIKTDKEIEAFELSKRELEVLLLIGEGLSYKEVAAKVERSINTIKVHRKNLCRKLNVFKQSELVRFMMTNERALRKKKK
jgi:DNA-binding NarL/FixJ family response regulator